MTRTAGPLLVIIVIGLRPIEEYMMTRTAGPLLVIIVTGLRPIEELHNDTHCRPVKFLLEIRFFFLYED